MITGIVAAVQAFFGAIAQLFNWLSNGRLIELGERRAEARVEEVAKENNKVAEAIDRQPVADRERVLDGLLPPSNRAGH